MPNEHMSSNSENDQPDEERIKFDPELDLTQAMAILSEGNPGSANVLAQLIQRDPLLLLDVDAAHIYGSEIYDVFNNTCNSDVDTFLEYLKGRREVSGTIRGLEEGQQ